MTGDLQYALEEAFFMRTVKTEQIVFINKRTNGPVAHLRDFFIVTLKRVLISMEIRFILLVICSITSWSFTHSTEIWPTVLGLVRML